MSRENILAACRAGVYFVASTPTTLELEWAFLEVPRHEFRPLDYLSQRQALKPETERTVYLGGQPTAH